jgi:hypothetical protein
MPLRRSNNHQPSFVDIQNIRFPLTDDGKRIIWGQVSDLALRERAMRDEVKRRLGEGKIIRSISSDS